MLSLNENILISKATVFNPLRDFFFFFFLYSKTWKREKIRSGKRYYRFTSVRFGACAYEKNCTQLAVLANRVQRVQPVFITFRKLQLLPRGGMKDERRIALFGRSSSTLAHRTHKFPLTTALKTQFLVVYRCGRATQDIHRVSLVICLPRALCTNALVQIASGFFREKKERTGGAKWNAFSP